MKTQTLMFFSFYLLVSCGFSQETAYKLFYPNSCKTVYERQISLLGSVSANPITNIPAVDEKKILFELESIDLGLSADLLQADQPGIPIYAQADLTSLKIGELQTPGPVEIIKVSGNYACLRLSPEKAGWIMLKHLDTETFRRNYQERLDQVKAALQNQLAAAICPTAAPETKF
jgi:hypothetical protein